MVCTGLVNDCRKLLQVLAAGRPVSGVELARQLGISRAAIWKQVEGLRANGLPIEAKPGQGYILQHALELLKVEAIRQALPATVRQRLGTIEVHWKLDSSSSEIQRRLKELENASFVFAEIQTHGRGRRGRSWQTPPTLGLTFSLLWRFDKDFSGLAGLSLAVGVAVAEALARCGACGIGLKWPNDLQHARTKLGGILVELSGDFLGPCQAMIGIGINLRLPTRMRDQLDQPVSDLTEACPGDLPSRNRLAASLVTALIQAMDCFAERGFAAFQQRYTTLDVLQGQTLRVFQGSNRPYQARGAGVDWRGALRVVHEAGRIEILDSAEVTVRTS